MSYDSSSNEDLPKWARDLKIKFINEMNDDMNISGALSAIFEIVNQGNKFLTNNEINPEQSNAILSLWTSFDSVLGFLIPIDEPIPKKIYELANSRLLARKDKNWDASDKFRDEINSLGWSIKDSSDGYELRKL